MTKRLIDKLKARRAELQLKRLNVTQEIVWLDEVIQEVEGGQDKPHPCTACGQLVGADESHYCKKVAG